MRNAISGFWEGILVCWYPARKFFRCSIVSPSLLLKEGSVGIRCESRAKGHRFGTKGSWDFVGPSFSNRSLKGSGLRCGNRLRNHTRNRHDLCVSRVLELGRFWPRCATHEESAAFEGYHIVWHFCFRDDGGVILHLSLFAHGGTLEDDRMDFFHERDVVLWLLC